MSVAVQSQQENELEIIPPFPIRRRKVRGIRLRRPNLRFDTCEIEKASRNHSVLFGPLFFFVING